MWARTISSASKTITTVVDFVVDFVLTLSIGQDTLIAFFRSFEIAERNREDGEMPLLPP